MRQVLLVAALLALLGSGCKKTAVEGIRWRKDVDAALAEAAATRKPAMIFVGANYDCASVMFHETTFPDRRVRRHLERDFVPIYLDVSEASEDDERKMARFRVFGTPATLIYAPDGKQLASAFSYLTPDALAAMLEKTRNGAVPSD